MFAIPFAVPGRPVDVSLDGWRGDWLFAWITIAITVLFAIMCSTMLWTFVFHRARAGRKAHFSTGMKRRNLLLTGLITGGIFFGVDGTALYHSQADLQGALWRFPGAAEAPVEIEVWAQQWAWNIRYAGADGKFGTPDDVVTLDDLRIPTGRPVVVQLRAKDVIHSFYLPNFRVKQDAIPGQTTRLWFQAQSEGTFELGCAQHCGPQHYKMHGALTALPPETFQRFITDESRAAERRYDPADTDAHWAWEWM